MVENKLVGGGFGGKEDVSVQHIAVLMALKVGRPVKVKFTRQESINFHPKRHAMRVLLLWLVMKMVFSRAWIAKSTLIPEPTHPFADRYWRELVLIPLDLTPIRTPISMDMVIIPITHLQELSADSVYAKVSMHWKC